jgi:type IV fimbrial biogenesis protein FimT
MKRCIARGFTLIELLISMAIAGILLVLALPHYAEWLADSEVRGGAESIASGMRFAMAEAVKRNAPVEFVLDPTTGTGGWVAQDVGASEMYQAGALAEGARRVELTVLPAGGTTVTFNGLGMIQPTNADASTPIERVRFRIAGVSSRTLWVLVGGTRTGIKICDAGFPATDPKGCPATGG